MSFCSRGSGRQEGEAGTVDQGPGSLRVTAAGGVLALGTRQKPGMEHTSQPGQKSVQGDLIRSEGPQGPRDCLSNPSPSPESPTNREGQGMEHRDGGRHAPTRSAFLNSLAEGRKHFLVE